MHAIEDTRYNTRYVHCNGRVYIVDDDRGTTTEDHRGGDDVYLCTYGVYTYYMYLYIAAAREGAQRAFVCSTPYFLLSCIIITATYSVLNRSCARGVYAHT